MHLLGFERQMCLTRTSNFAKSLENAANDLLNATIRIEAETDLPMPDVADWHRDPELTSSRL